MLNSQIWNKALEINSPIQLPPKIQHCSLLFCSSRCLLLNLVTNILHLSEEQLSSVQQVAELSVRVETSSVEMFDHVNVRVGNSTCVNWTGAGRCADNTTNRHWLYNLANPCHHLKFYNTIIIILILINSTSLPSALYKVDNDRILGNRNEIVAGWMIDTRPTRQSHKHKCTLVTNNLCKIYNLLN